MTTRNSSAASDRAPFLSSYTGARRDIARLVPPEARYILDVGCSDGALGQHLKQLQPDRVVHGMERDPAFCVAATARLDRVFQADLDSIDLETISSAVDQYDCLIFADVLEHLIAPGDVLSNSLQLLRPGGTAIISVPNIRHLSALGSIFITGEFPRRPRGIFDASHLRWFTHKDLVALARDAGLVEFHTRSNLRLFDAPGGIVNRALYKYSDFLGKLSLAREFLGYQHILVGHKVTP